MTAIPDAKTVREIAREIILDCGRNADDIGAYVWVRVGADLSKHEHGAWCSAIREAIRTAQIAMSWPDEQPQDDGDVRAGAAFLTSDKLGPAMAALHDCFADRIAALDARDAKTEAGQR